MSGQRSLWVLLLAAILHIAEEYLLDWRSWVEVLSGLAIEWSRFYLVNTAFLAFAVSAAWRGWRSPVVALAFPALTLINAVLFHIGPSLVTGRLSPGTITSVLLYLPIGGWVYWRAKREGVLTRRVAVLSISLGAGIMALPFVALFWGSAGSLAGP